MTRKEQPKEDVEVERIEAEGEVERVKTRVEAEEVLWIKN